MRGSVVRRDSRYYVKIELDPDPITGVRRQKWHSGFATKREAERARVDLLSKFDRGEYVEPTQETLGSYLLEWLETIRPTLRPGTHETYTRDVYNHVIPYIGSVKLTKVDGGMLSKLYAKLLASGRLNSSRHGAGYSKAVIERAIELRRNGATLQATADRLREEMPEARRMTKDTLASLLRRQASSTGGFGGGPLAPRSVQKVHVILHRAFKDAIRWDRLHRNPCDAADPPRVPQFSGDSAEVWDAGTLRTFLEGCKAKDDRNYALWVLLASTGMRRGEALGLRWSDVDLDAGRLRIVETLITIRGKTQKGEPKTARGRRPVALDPATVSVLREHRARMDAEREIAGDEYEDSGLVFHKPNGRRLLPETISVGFKTRAKREGLPYLTLKGLRHTWATLALEAGIHPRVVQERLGHSTISITLGIYTHVSPILHEEAAAQVAALFLSPV